MKLLTILIVITLTSCLPSYKTIPLKSTYSDGNFEEYSDKTKDQVWDNVIDFFAKAGLSIRIIDRASGLIISGQTSLKTTYENTKGELVKKDAWVVVAKTIDQYKKVVPATSVTGEWNVRLKEVNGKTLINVNLVSPTYIGYTTNVSTAFKKGSIQSTGVFEKMIYDIVK